MISRTVTTVVEAQRDDVFSFLAEIDNLPAWATDFARELKYVDGKPKVVNGLGEFFFSIDAHAETGVIDMYAGPTEEAMALFPTRVVGLGRDRCAYTFTMFKRPELAEELFESQYRSLLRELENLRGRFEGGSTGPEA